MNSSRRTHRVVIYARTATAEPGSLERIAEQARLVRKALDERIGASTYGVVAEISDVGAGGSHLRRDGFERVQRLVAEGQVDIVAATDRNRLVRNVSELMRLESEWQELGVQLFCTQIDLPSDMFQRAILIAATRLQLSAINGDSR